MLIADERVGSRFEPEVPTEARQLVEFAGSFGAEAKVFPDHHDACAERNQHIRREFAWVLRGKPLVERNDVDMTALHGSFAETFFAFEGRKQRRGVVSEDFGRMGIEGEDDGLELSRTGESSSFSEYGLMSAMNTVEVADGDEAGWFFLFVHGAILSRVRNQHGREAQSLNRAKRDRTNEP